MKAVTYLVFHFCILDFCAAIIFLLFFSDIFMCFSPRFDFFKLYF